MRRWPRRVATDAVAGLRARCSGRVDRPIPQRRVQVVGGACVRGGRARVLAQEGLIDGGAHVGAADELWQQRAKAVRPDAFEESVVLRRDGRVGRLLQHTAARHPRDRPVEQRLGSDEKRGIRRRRVQLGEALQEHALVVRPRIVWAADDAARGVALLGDHAVADQTVRPLAHLARRQPLPQLQCAPQVLCVAGGGQVEHRRVCNGQLVGDCVLVRATAAPPQAAAAARRVLGRVPHVFKDLLSRRQVVRVVEGARRACKGQHPPLLVVVAASAEELYHPSRLAGMHPAYGIGERHAPGRMA